MCGLFSDIKLNLDLKVTWQFYFNHETEHLMVHRTVNVKQALHSQSKPYTVHSNFQVFTQHALQLCY
jgi:hypothetical protein